MSYPWSKTVAGFPLPGVAVFFLSFFFFLVFYFLNFKIFNSYMRSQTLVSFKTWFLTVPWTARISNQSILKEISPEYSLEGLMLKL